MKKTIILSILATFSLTLSYFYEVTPAESATLPEPVATITPYAINSGEDLNTAVAMKAPLVMLPEPEPAPAPKPESEAFYSKKLRMQFATSKNKDLVQTVAGWLGTPYRYGSGSKKGTDCSGFVTSIYREVYGVKLSRSSHAMYAQNVKKVKRANLRTGDLVFFKRGPRQPIFHVGIYLKNGRFIHSATNGGVMVSSLNEKFYSKTYYAGGRVN